MEKEIEIPEGYEARIEGNKVIIEPMESEDEKIRKAIEGTIRVYGKTQGEWLCGYNMDTLVIHLREAFSALEKQKEQKPLPGFDELTPDEKMNHPLYLEGFDVGRKVGQVEAGQKPTEWSDEDNRKIAELKTFIAQCNGFNKANRQKAFDMIDALRPQPHWKPSEEQMDALAWYSGDRGAQPTGDKAIKSLYNDLKKQL